MNEHDEFIVESDDPELTVRGDLTGWETVVFEVADEEAEGE